MGLDSVSMSKIDKKDERMKMWFKRICSFGWGLFSVIELGAGFSPVLLQNGKVKVETVDKKLYVDGFFVLPVLPAYPGARRATFARLPLLLDKNDDLFDYDGFSSSEKITKNSEFSEPVENPKIGLTKNQKNDFKDNLLKTKVWREEDIKAKRLFRLDCFYEVMGVYEIEFRNWDLKLEPDWKRYPPLEALRKTLDGFVELSKGGNLAFGRNALCGSRFEAATVKDLKQAVDGGRKTFIRPGEGFFELVDGYAIKSAQSFEEALKLTDIAYLQEHYPGAVFQIASTFSTLEGGMGKGTSNYGKLLETMQHTPTQGESAALATMGAAIIRKYCLPPINLLENLAAVVMNKSREHAGLVWKIKKELIAGDVDKIKVGLHADVVVTSGYYGCYSQKLTGAFSKDSLLAVERIKFLEDRLIVSKGREPFFIFNSRIDLSDPKKLIRVDQVFTSALKVNEKNAFKRGLTENNARIILEAAYKGTMYAAAMRAIEKRNAGTLVGRQKVFLTAMGAGAFGNEVAWIVDILKQPWFEELIKEFGLEVYLVVYPSTRDDRQMALKDLKLLRDLAAQLPQRKDDALGKLARSLRAIAQG